MAELLLRWVSREGGSDTGTLWALADYSEIADKLLWHEFVLPQ